MASCLVTGGCGFLGSHLVEGLLAGGHSVCVLDDLSTGRRENLRAVWERVHFLRGSVTDPGQVHDAVAGVEWVFHLAALPSVQRSFEDPLGTHAVCATGTLQVLEAAYRAGVRRVVYAASSSAYGDAPGIVRRESDPCRPLSPFASAKLAGEHYCSCYHRAHRLETVCLRLFNVFGPRQDADSPSTGVVARFVAALHRGERPVIHGDGRQTRDFTYVDNAVEAFLLAARSSAAPGNHYNVGTGRRVSVRQLLRELSRLLGRDIRPVYAARRAGDVQGSQADVGRARQDLGYEPRVYFLEGLRRTLRASGHDQAQTACSQPAPSSSCPEAQER